MKLIALGGDDEEAPRGPDISRIAIAIGEPVREKMLSALMDGRALTATELALEGGVSTSTASSHLAKLQSAGLIALAAQGRHRYFRIASPEIAELLERLAGIAAAATPVVTGPRDERLREARVCYDHLAGRWGVALLDQLCANGALARSDDRLELTRSSEAWCATAGIDLASLRRRSRPLLRPCLDWSERRDHLAGSLGAAILSRLLELRIVRRALHGRTLQVSTGLEAFTAFAAPRK